MNYYEFLQRKAIVDQPTGLTEIQPLNPMLFKWQADIVQWALKRGRAALLEDCGLGKTPQQLVWADEVIRATNKNVIILTPLAVAKQTIREAAKFGIEARYCRSQTDVKKGITVTNYEMLDSFDPSSFIGVVLDESSILKSFMGKTKQRLIEAFRNTPYKLCCTATPAPNDHMELGNHAEFLGIMPSNEMLSRWFINDPAHVGHYRLKGHAESSFWDWVASWAVCIAKPSDIGYSDDGFILPPLIIEESIVDVTGADMMAEGSFLPMVSLNATDIHRVMRKTAAARAERSASLSSGFNEPVIYWCNTDYEADALKEAIPDAIEVRGSHPLELKQEHLAGFAEGAFQKMITKPKIAAFGLNYQICSKAIVCGLSYSYEQLYQLVCRCHRYGQTKPVNVWLIVAETEIGVLESIKRKQVDHRRMQAAMVGAMREAEIKNINPAARKSLTNDAGNQEIILPDWLVA